MKIKTNKKIQALVDKRKGSSLTRIAALHIAAGGELNETAGPEAHENGVQDGIRLMEEFEKRRERTVFEAGQLEKEGKFGIYRATQDTSDGFDVLYFIGTPGGICRRLEAVPEDA